MAQVKEVVVSVSTPEVDPQTLSPKIYEKSQNLPDEPKSAGDENEMIESEICTPPDPKIVTESSASTPSDYEMRKKANISAFKEKCKEFKIDELNKILSSFEDVQEGLEKAPPRVVREVPPLSVTTRQKANRPQIFGNLENLEAKKEEEKRIKLAQKLERKQTREEEKQEKTKTNNLFEQIMKQDPLIRRLDNLSESSVGTPKRKIPTSDLQMGMHNSQTPDQANKSFDSLRSVSTLSGMKTLSKTDKSVLSDDFSWSSSSSETESLPKKAKIFQKKPETTKKSPTKNSKSVAPKSNKKSPTKKLKTVGCDVKTAKIKPFQCYKCNQVFKVKTSVKGHFKNKHSEDAYDSTKVRNVKFQCYNCTSAFDSYGKIMKHFEQMYPAETLDPKKIYLGKTKKSAAILLKLKYGPPPPEIVKKLHGINKTVPTKMKKVVKITKQIYTFRCSECEFKHSEFEKVVQHKQKHHQGK